MNVNGEKIPQDIHDDMSFVSLHLFVAIDAALLAIILSFLISKILQPMLFCVVKRSRLVDYSPWRVGHTDESHPISAGLVAARVS